MPSPHTPRPDGELPKRVRGSGKQVGGHKAGGGAGKADPAPAVPGPDTPLPRLTGYSSLGSRANDGESRAGSPPAAAAVHAKEGEGRKGLFERRGDRARREGFRGALGVVGVVGLLAAVAVALTLGLGGRDDGEERDGASVVVGSDGYDADDVEGLGRPADPSASPSADRNDEAARDAKDGEDPDASPKPSTSASPGGSAAPEASTAPGGGQATAPDDAAGAPAAGGAEPPEPQAVPGVGVFSHASQRCLDIVGGRASVGAALKIQDCSGAASQRWTFPSDGTMRALGLCVRLAGGSTEDGTDLRMGPCDGGADQRFSLNSRHDVVSSLADKCADVRDELTANGTRIQLWTCNGHDNQKWSTS